jgi:hypothetical protein
VNENPDGILGNLPRSRPGVRSEKRAGGGSAPKPAAATAKAAAPKPRAAKPRVTGPVPPKAAPAPPAPPPQPPSGRDPLEQAVHLAGEVAETSLKVFAKVAGGVLRRLPRP